MIMKENTETRKRHKRSDAFGLPQSTKNTKANRSRVLRGWRGCFTRRYSGRPLAFFLCVLGVFVVNLLRPQPDRYAYYLSVSLCLRVFFVRSFPPLSPIHDRIALDRGTHGHGGRNSQPFAPRGARACSSIAAARFEPGQITLIVGPSGAGKSLLLRVLAGLIGPGDPEVDVQGQLYLDDREVLSSGGACGRVGVVFQSSPCSTSCRRSITCGSRPSIARQAIGPAGRSLSRPGC